jgi:hypothetical protein
MIRTIIVWQGIWIVSALLTTQAATTGDQHATRYHDDKYGFSVLIPAGWEKAPRALTEAAQKEIESYGMEYTPEILAQYVLQVEGRFAVMQIQAMRYPNGHQPSERWMRQFVSGNTGIDKEQLDKATHGKLSGRIRDIEIEDVEFKLKQRSFAHTFSMTVPGVGKIRGCSRDHFGHESVAGVSCFSPESSFSSLESQLRTIVESFRFDPGMRYEVIEWYESRAFSIGLLVAAGVVLAAVFRRK